MDEFLGAPGGFVSNANIGDKAGTNRILRVKRAIFVSRLETNNGRFTRKMRFVPALSPILGFGTNIGLRGKLGRSLTRIMGDSRVKCDSFQLYPLY